MLAAVQVLLVHAVFTVAKNHTSATPSEGEQRNAEHLHHIDAFRPTTLYICFETRERKLSHRAHVTGLVTIIATRPKGI